MPRRKPNDPDRSPDLPHNWINRHLDGLEEYLLYDPILLDDWDYRKGCLVGPNQFQFYDQEWGSISLGEPWGGPDITGFFKKTIQVPESHTGENIFLDLSLDGGEAQLRINGKPWQGLDWYRSLVPLGSHASQAGSLDLELEAYVINFPYDARREDQRDFHLFQTARLVKLDREVEEFLNQARWALEAYRHLWEHDLDLELEGYLLHHLESACREIGLCLTSRQDALDRVRKARVILQDRLFESPYFKSAGTVFVHAHSHLDLVYLWPIKETLRKNCRTVTNQLSLMREYPEYRFSYSQPYLYEKLEQIYPDVFEEVKQRIQEGRWEAIGGMYIEPDGNLPGGESMVRQILLGKQYLRSELGTDSDICWLIDVFGVMYTLPQILVKSGINYFTTVKLNVWNDTNTFPYDTFRWRGPDGSEVITHFPPTHFAQAFSFPNLRTHWQRFREREVIAENLMIYGYGDGGGGPTREMVDLSTRMNSFTGLPDTQLSSACDFFARLDKHQGNLPVWDDELYLEAHRGTLTTRSDLKRLNRKSELLYRDAEIISALAAAFGGPAVQTDLNQGWKLILLNQFHDTLTGTHTQAGENSVKQDYDTAQEIGTKVLKESLDFLSSRIRVAKTEQRSFAVLNTLAWTRGGLIKLPAGCESQAVTNRGTDYPTQRHLDELWVKIPNLPSLGWTVINPADLNAELPDTAAFDQGEIKTPNYQIKIASDGSLSSIFDLQNRREILAGPGNQFQVFVDDPGYKFSAWDIASHFDAYQEEVSLIKPWELVSNGPIFAAFEAAWQVKDSVIKQQMWLYPDDRRIDFRTRVTWANCKLLLKVAFPVQVRAKRATYDLPFGNISRPTHRNTSWDEAKFEVCGHKFADLSSQSYGVALINDCKYGYDVRENVIRLSLIRSPIRPNPASDLGEHVFEYALLPHEGTWQEAEVDREAYGFNIPPLVREIRSQSDPDQQSLPQDFSYIEALPRGLILETMKQAEDGQGLIMRTFENHGGQRCWRADFELPPQSMVENNLLEEPWSPSPPAGTNGQKLTYKAYEIKTHRLKY